MLTSLPFRMVLSPLTMTQAVLTRRRIPPLPEAQGPRQGVTGAGPALSLLVIGDNAAAGVGAATLDQSFAGFLVRDLSRDFTVHWRVVASARATSAEILARLLTTDLGHVDVAVTALGVGDIRQGVSRRRFRKAQRGIAALLLGHGARQIWRTGLPPVEYLPVVPRPWRDMLGAKARLLDTVLRADSQPPLYRLPYDPALLKPELRTPDGFHPRPEACAEWARRQAREIRMRA